MTAVFVLCAFPALAERRYNKLYHYPKKTLLPDLPEYGGSPRRPVSPS
jgi:hypothetical protein